MGQKFNILIADKNPHVRELLKREMIADGYRVHLAQNAHQLLKWLYHNEHFDILIVDPDFPDADVSSLLNQLQEHFPLLPVVIHTIFTDFGEYTNVLRVFPFVEKQGGSIDQLKNVVFDILHKLRQKHS